MYYSQDELQRETIDANRRVPRRSSKEDKKGIESTSSSYWRCQLLRSRQYERSRQTRDYGIDEPPERGSMLPTERRRNFVQTGLCRGLIVVDGLKAGWTEETMLTPRRPNASFGDTHNDRIGQVRLSSLEACSVPGAP